MKKKAIRTESAEANNDERVFHILVGGALWWGNDGRLAGTLVLRHDVARSTGSELVIGQTVLRRVEAPEEGFHLRVTPVASKRAAVKGDLTDLQPLGVIGKLDTNKATHSVLQVNDHVWGEERGGERQEK